MREEIWSLEPTTEHTATLLQLFVAPGGEPPNTEVGWMTLMATCCRTTLAPPPLPDQTLTRRADLPCIIAVGEHDRFLPPHRLAPAARRTMNLDIQMFPGMGHLTTAPHRDQMVSLVAQLIPAPSR